MRPIPGRRQFLQSSLAAFAAPAIGEVRIARESGAHIRLGLNSYSFNKPLTAGSTTLEDVIHYCAHNGIDLLDATGYYFPNYPKVPSDDYIYNLKRTAFVNGVTIGGTGVRNDFAVVDEAARKRDVQLVKDWIEVASKLGAPVIRVFSGKQRPAGRSFDQVLEWMVPEFKDCAAYGKRHGVILVLQNHNDFIQTADETIQILNEVGSDWFGAMLDVGSLRRNDPYAEIEKLVPYAVSWQLKETVWYGSKETPIDLKRIKSIIGKTGYRGLISIETLGDGDPRAKVAKFLEQVRRDLAI